MKYDIFKTGGGLIALPEKFHLKFNRTSMGQTHYDVEVDTIEDLYEISKHTNCSELILCTSPGLESIEVYDEWRE